MTRRRSLAWDDQRERGSSLTELLVVMLIMGIITAAVASLTIGFQRTNAQNISRQDQIDAARTAVERISKTVRTAVKPSQLTTTCTLTFCTEDAFMRAENFSVQFYANLNNDKGSIGPSRVSYAVANSGVTAGQLVEKVQRPDSKDPTSTGYAYCDAEAVAATNNCKDRLTTRVVARGIQTPAGAPLFKYYDTTGTRLIPDAATGTLTTAQLEQVLSIELTVAVQSVNARAVPTTYIQRVTLPNSQAVIRQGSETP
jgi:prepilin-type N-terminal cleavage/methylation domain-containing protein